ncbi:Uncharacterised protein [Mycobacteroides abscessus subsp. abscessus]|nr:Uncharacterised protein [Mycobacteroides abscessus subsp. abscessus]
MWSDVVKNIFVVKVWSKALFRHKKDPQPNRLRAFETLIINVLRTEVHDERL